MSEERERREDRDDEELTELRRRRTRDDDDAEPRNSKRGHKTQPKIKKFQIWFEFGKSTVTADYEIEGDFGAEDLERFVDDLLENDFRLYRKKEYKKPDSRNYNNRSGGGYGGRGGRNYEN